MNLKDSDYQLADKIIVRADYFNEEYNYLVKERENEIESIWNEEQERRKKKLFNGKILNLGRIDDSGKTLLLQCHPIEYKHYLAQRNGIDLGITPLAVSGITYYVKDGNCFFLVGQRSLDVTQYPGFYEFAPSGSIDINNLDHNNHVDFMNQLVEELEEEIGINKTEVKNINVFTLIYDDAEKVYDIGIKINLGEFDLNKACTKNSYEYRRIKGLNTQEVENIFTKNNQIVQTSKTLFEAWKKLI